MRREVFFLQDPNAHVQYRMEAIQNLQESLFGNLTRQEKAEKYVALASEQLKLVIAGYSRGDDLERLRRWFREVMHAWNEARKLGADAPDIYLIEEYHPVLWTLSLARLFGFQGESFYQLVRDLGVAGKDMVIDLLLLDLMDKTAKGILHAPYKLLVDAANDAPEQAGVYVGNFMRQYYASQEKCSWYDTHVKHEPQFFGYWSFELAVIVRELGWEDRDFADNIFYPRDLVQPQMYRTWLDGEAGESDREKVREAEASAIDLDALAEALQQEAGGKSPDPEDLLLKLTGLAPEEYAEQPEKLQAAVRQLLKAMTASVRQLKAAAEGETTEFEDIIRQANELERDLGGRSDNSGEFQTGAAGKLAAPYVELEGAVKEELVETESETKPDVFLERMVQLMDQFDKLIHWTKAGKDRSIEQRVSQEIGASLDERRKARGGGKFDLNDLLD